MNSFALIYPLSRPSTAHRWLSLFNHGTVRHTCRMAVLSAGFFLASAPPAFASAIVQILPALSGEVHGEIRVLSAEDLTLRGNVRLTGSLLVPGTPTLRLQGKGGYGALLTGPGSASPHAHSLTISGHAWIQSIVQRVDPVALPAVANPLPPLGTRSVVINGPGASLGDPATLRNLTLNGNAGAVAVPPGAYGQFIVNGGNTLILGEGGASGPLSIYHLSGLILNGNAHLHLAGPVRFVVGSTWVLNGTVGSAVDPSRLQVELAEPAGLIMNGNARLFADVRAPGGTVTINGPAEFTGSLAAQRLVAQGNPILRFQSGVTNQVPVVVLTSPVDGASYAPGVSVPLAADASDPDGSIVRVEFHYAGGLIAVVTAPPYAHAWVNPPSGLHAVTARATDNAGAVTVSSAVTFQITSNATPSVVLLAPETGAALAASEPVIFDAAASDPDGPIARVEFIDEGDETLATVSTPTTLPDRYAAAVVLPPGHFTVRARAFDLSGTFADSGASIFRVVPGLPYVTGFEPQEHYLPGRLSGANGWTLLAGTAEIQAANAAFGQQFAVLLPGTPVARLQQDFFASPSPVLFFEVFARLPAATDGLPVAGFETAHARVALRAVDGLGEVWVPVHGGWRAASPPVRLPLGENGRTEAWVRYTVREDHASQIWDLYVNGVLAERGLPFRTPADGGFPRFTAIGHGSAPVEFDDLYVGEQNPLFPDADGDGIDDAYEVANGLDPTRNDAAEDLDGDGLANLQEFLRGTRANVADSDGDGMPDGWEVRHGLDPLAAAGANDDSDGDGVSDLREFWLGRNPAKGAVLDDGTHVGLSVHAPATSPLTVSLQ